jgi:hypothetical protein
LLLVIRFNLMAWVQHIIAGGGCKGGRAKYGFVSE